MEYRILPHGGEKVSVIGLSSHTPALVNRVLDMGTVDGLDVALINKYYDLALQGDALAREHYLTLEKRAGDCIGYGHCNGRCPFHVAQSRRMQEILAYFGA